MTYEELYDTSRYNAIRRAMHVDVNVYFFTLPIPRRGVVRRRRAERVREVPATGKSCRKYVKAQKHATDECQEHLCRRLRDHFDVEHECCWCDFRWTTRVVSDLTTSATLYENATTTKG